jgi:spore maturation protein SpmA
MNRVFFAIIVIAFVFGGFREWGWEPPVDDPEALSPMQAVTDGLFTSIKAAVVDVVFPLVGAMAFFLGIMKVAERAGATDVLARFMRPLMRLLFPDVPANHPAMSAMVLNFAANGLGLGNAATPFGIKAMQELDRLNGEKGTATNAMALFLAINTASVTLLPSGVIGIRASLGSIQPAGIMPTTLAATVIGTGSAIAMAKLFQRFAPEPPLVEDPRTTTAGDPGHVEEGWPLWLSVLVFVVVLAIIPLTVIYGNEVSPWIVPIIVVGFLTFGMARGVAVYEALVEGAKEGFETAVRIIPYVVAILGAIGMLRGSGAIELFARVVGPITAPFGLPAEVIPMTLLRPLSGTGAYGVMIDTMKTYGPDSYIGYLVSTLQGTSETTFYVIAVYYGAVQVQRIRHTMVVALLADVIAVVASVAACVAYFRWNGLSF